MLFFRWNYSIDHHCRSYSQQRELPSEPPPNNCAKAPVQTSARNRARKPRIRCRTCVQRPFNEHVAIAQQVHSKHTAIKLLLCDLVQCVCWCMNHLQLISSKPGWAQSAQKKQKMKVCTQMKSVCTQMHPSEKNICCTRYIKMSYTGMYPVHSTRR